MLTSFLGHVGQFLLCLWNPSPAVQLSGSTSEALRDIQTAQLYSLESLPFSNQIFRDLEGVRDKIFGTTQSNLETLKTELVDGINGVIYQNKTKLKTIGTPALWKSLSIVIESGDDTDSSSMVKRVKKLLSEGTPVICTSELHDDSGEKLSRSHAFIVLGFGKDSRGIPVFKVKDSADEVPFGVYEINGYKKLIYLR